MRIAFKLGYHEAIVDLSGAEVEVLHRILAKMTFVSNEYVGGAYRPVFVQSPPEWEVKMNAITTPVMTRDEYNAAREEEKVKARAAMVKGILEGEKVVGCTDDLRIQLYYDGFIKKSEEAKALAFEPLSVEHGVVDFYDDSGSIHRINADGSYEFWPVKVE